MSCVYKLHQTKAKPTSQYDTQVVHPDRLDLFWACYNPQKQTMMSSQTLLIETTTSATKHGSWTVETFRLPIIWKTASLTWTKPIRKFAFQTCSIVDKQTTKSRPPSPDSMLFFGSRTVSWQASLPTSTLHKGEGGERSNCGRVKKGETVSEWCFGCLLSVVIA